MSESNGEKRILINWLVGIIFALSSWALLSAVQAKADISALKAASVAKDEDVSRRLDSIERKLDRLLFKNR